MRRVRKVRKVRLSFAIVSLALVMAIPPTSAGAMGAPCRATDLRTKAVYEGAGSNLQSAIDAAGRGTRLRVRGVCVGTFVIAKNLKLVGYPTVAYPTPTLDGNASGTVLTVSKRYASVTLRNLTITGGRSTRGGGIYNLGTLTLLGSTSVSANSAAEVGGGIYNEGSNTVGGTLALHDTAQVNDNVATNGGGGIMNYGTVSLHDDAMVSGNSVHSGGGISNYWGTLALHDSAQVSGNTADWYGGGIINYQGTLTLDGSSLVTGNTAEAGGGIENRTDGGGDLILDDSASVTGNTAVYYGGGINTSAAIGVCHGPGSFWVGAISPNTPDDPPTPTLITCEPTWQTSRVTVPVVVSETGLEPARPVRGTRPST